MILQHLKETFLGSILYLRWINIRLIIKKEIYIPDPDNDYVGMLESPWILLFTSSLFPFPPLTSGSLRLITPERRRIKGEKLQWVHPRRLMLIIYLLWHLFLLRSLILLVLLALQHSISHHGLHSCWYLRWGTSLTQLTWGRLYWRDISYAWSRSSSQL